MKFNTNLLNYEHAGFIATFMRKETIINIHTKLYANYNFLTSRKSIKNILFFPNQTKSYFQHNQV